MSFSINESKVEELLKSASKGYEVSGGMAEGSETQNYAPCYTVSWTDYAAPILVTPESREHLMALRRKIEESGVPLKSADDLTAEISRMRRNE
jgi:hypothetical protein